MDQQDYWILYLYVSVSDIYLKTQPNYVRLLRPTSFSGDILKIHLEFSLYNIKTGR